MDFEKKYPLTQFRGEHVVVQWTRGYKDVDLYYRDELILQHRGAGKLKAGITYSTAQLGNIKLSLSEKPVMLNVIVDEYHSPVNVSHPVKELKSMSTYFWILMAFGIIAGAIEIGIFRDTIIEGLVILINVIVFGVYLTSALLVRKGYPVGYFIGFGVFTFINIVSLLLLLNGFMWGFMLYIFEAIRIGGQVVLSINMKTAIQASKHRKYKFVEEEGLLDANL